MRVVAPCVPDQLPLPALDWGGLVRHIGQAQAELARFDGVLAGMVNPEVLLSPLTTNEAVLSSKMEGTVSTLQDVLRFEASDDEVDPEKRNDIQEVLNYRRAMWLAIEELRERPITLNLIRSIHSVLMQGVRGRDKSPGKFRTTQNHIGKRNCPIEDARFIPPAPVHLQDCLGNYEDYLAFDERDALVQTAIVHAQFEIIHPFMDGNGRVGRILIPLFLFSRGLLSSPVFYISSYLETHQEEYNDRLLAITDEGDWNGWVGFFLTAVREQAKANLSKAKAILRLYDEMKGRIEDVTRSQYVMRGLDAIFTRPIFNSTMFIERSGIPKQTGLRMLNQLREGQVITLLKEASGSRPAVYGFYELVNIADQPDFV